MSKKYRTNIIKRKNKKRLKEENNVYSKIHIKYNKRISKRIGKNRKTY
jgi:hypothetical protein